MSTTTSATKSKSPTGRTRRSSPKSSREVMIAEAAYYIAEKRGFAEGDQVQDWLAAEFQIDSQAPARKRKAVAK